MDWEEMFDLIGLMLRYDPTRRLALRWLLKVSKGVLGDPHDKYIHATVLSECMEHPFLKKFKLRGASRSTSSCVLR